MNLNNLFILGPRMHLRTSLYEINRVALMIKSDFAKSQKPIYSKHLAMERPRQLNF